ncbi:MAG: hypothetical protein JWO24_4146 [Rhodospirillales bacterium]|nr:hypothetical protein [Rhodospirillales bacterium]
MNEGPELVTKLSRPQYASPETTNFVANEIDFIVPGLIARYSSTYGEFNTIYELSRFLSPCGICRAFDQLKSCGMLKHMKDGLNSTLAEAIENASLERLDDDQANQLVIDCIAAGTMPGFLPRLVERMGNAGFNLCRALEYAIKKRSTHGAYRPAFSSRMRVPFKTFALRNGRLAGLCHREPIRTG